MTRLLGLAMAAAMCTIAVACASVPVLPESGSSTPSVVSRGCEHVSRHQYEVCYAYIANDSLLARVPYYQVGRQPVLGPLALTRLESRYYGQARRFLIEQTKRWPRRVDVSVPAIRIVGRVTVSANLGTATITTVETWLVRAEPRAGSPSGRVLFAETDVRHMILPRRAPPTPPPACPSRAQR